MTQIVRVGLIGTSWWMDFAYLPTLRTDLRVTVVAICGRNAERAQEMADKYGVPAVFTDYRDMIARADLDAVVIASPDDLHYKMTLAALDAGLHVLCEKPLALNASDARAMYDRAEAEGVRHMAYFTWRWMPHYRYMRELIEQGILGRLYYAQFSFMMGGARSPAYQWRLDRARANGVIGDLGSHMFDLARYLVGDITRVSAHLASHVQREGADGRPADSASDAAMVLVEFADGAQGTVQVSMVARIGDPLGEQEVVLQGEAASLKANLAFGSSGMQLQLARGDELWQPVAIPDHYFEGVDRTKLFHEQMLAMFARQSIGSRLFVDGILADRAVVPSFYEGWKAQEVIDAAIASSESGCWAEVQQSTGSLAE